MPKRSRSPSISKNLRVKLIGLLKCALSPAIIAAWSFMKAAIGNATAWSAIIGWVNETVPIINETTGEVIGYTWQLTPVVVDLSVVPTILVVAASVFLLISGLRQLGGFKV